MEIVELPRIIMLRSQYSVWKKKTDCIGRGFYDDETFCSKVCLPGYYTASTNHF